MQKSYIRKYADRFNLYTDGYSCWNIRGDKVLELQGNKIFYRENYDTWKWGKEGDLLICIINNIPLCE